MTRTLEVNLNVRYPPRHTIPACVQSSCRRILLGLPGPRFTDSDLFVGGEVDV